MHSRGREFGTGWLALQGMHVVVHPRGFVECCVAGWGPHEVTCSMFGAGVQVASSRRDYAAV